MPSYGFGFNVNDLNKHIGEKVGGYGERLRADVKKFYGSVVGISGRGECIAREDNYCELDPEVVDEFGVPVLRFNYTWTVKKMITDLLPRGVSSMKSGPPVWEMIPINQ